MNESQKAELLVTDYAGNPIEWGKYAVSIAPSDVAHEVWAAQNYPHVIVADKPGTFTITVTHQDGRTGILEVVVTAAPLMVALGTLEPK